MILKKMKNYQFQMKIKTQIMYKINDLIYLMILIKKIFELNL